MASLQKKPGLTGPMQAVANGAPPPPIQNTARRMLNGGRSARDPILDMSLDSHSWSPIWSTGHIAKQHSFSHLERQSVHTWTRNDRFRHMTTHAKEYQPIEKRADDSVHRKEPKQLICSKWQTPRKAEHMMVRRTTLTERIHRDVPEKMYTGRSDLTDFVPDTPHPMDSEDF